LFTLALPEASLDLIWCVNTINHLRNPVQGLIHLKTLLRSGGRIAVGQSSVLPDMYFAWDARLERATNEAVRRYYLDRYSLEERELTDVRRLVGRLRDAGFSGVAARTVVIERIAPLDAAGEAYLRDTIFRDTWGERLKPYISSEDHAELSRLCDPQHPQFALRRPDFHFLQSFTLVVAEA
jgi:SAM-dependent methyltransferase